MRSRHNRRGMTYAITKTDEEWRAELLSPEEYHVLREAGTERAFTRRVHRHQDRGRLQLPGLRGRAVPERHEVRLATAAGRRSTSRSEGDAVELLEDRSFGMRRTEVRVPAVRLPPRARLRRRPPDPDRRSVLHQLGRRSPRGGRSADRRRQAPPAGASRTSAVVRSNTITACSSRPPTSTPPIRSLIQWLPR